MVCELCKREEITFRRMNRVLRTVNSLLRRRMDKVKQGADEIFVALCDTDKQAEIALGELWGSGLFDCGPQDYDFIVEQCITTLRQSQKPNL